MIFRQKRREAKTMEEHPFIVFYSNVVQGCGGRGDRSQLFSKNLDKQNVKQDAMLIACFSFKLNRILDENLILNTQKVELQGPTTTTL